MLENVARFPEYEISPGKYHPFERAHPEKAMELEARSTLLPGLERGLTASGMTQEEAAKALSLTQVRVSQIRRGKLGRFKLEELFRLAAKAGVHPQVKLAA